MIFTSVDLPAPLSPISPTTSPARSASETSVSAWIAPKCLEIPSSSRTAAAIRLLGRALAEVGRRALPHLERPLADLGVAASGLERVELRRQGVAGDDDQVLGLELGHHLVGHLGVGLRPELSPATDEDEGVELRVLREDVGHLLVREVDLVVREQRAAGDLGPATLAGDLGDALLAADRVAGPGVAGVDIVGRDVAQLQAHRAAL